MLHRLLLARSFTGHKNPTDLYLSQHLWNQSNKVPNRLHIPTSNNSQCTNPINTFKKLEPPPVSAGYSGGVHAVNNVFTVEASFISRQPINFLVDTGSSFSILPISITPDTLAPMTVLAANGTSVKFTGTSTLSFTLANLTQTFTHTFHIGDTIYPILGSDFFHKESLNIDCRNRRLFTAPPLHTTTTVSTSSKLLSINHILNPTNIHDTIHSTFPNVITKNQSTTRPIESIHYIPTLPCIPQHNRARPLSILKRESVEKEFLQLEKSGVIRRSSSGWASPLHIVTKKTAHTVRVGIIVNLTCTQFTMPIPCL